VKHGPCSPGLKNKYEKEEEMRLQYNVAHAALEIGIYKYCRLLEGGLVY
jgi:hypothetical protein